MIPAINTMNPFTIKFSESGLVIPFTPNSSSEKIVEVLYQAANEIVITEEDRITSHPFKIYINGNFEECVDSKNEAMDRLYQLFPNKLFSPKSKSKKLK